MPDQQTLLGRAKQLGLAAWRKANGVFKAKNGGDGNAAYGYPLTWVTDDLATGYAPMSYDDLDAIKAQGIDAIVNLCGEFCDLHDIEQKSGFEVYYLPIPDECAPDMEDIESALAWLDEAFYLGKKVLVHCRHGIGRTGTFVTSYLLRRGLGMKVASKKLRKTQAQPSTYAQWKLLKDYGRKEGVLKVREPTLESRNVVDLGTYFDEYESLFQQIEAGVAQTTGSGKLARCGLDSNGGCYVYRELQLIEVIYLTVGMNRTLSSDLRMEAIHDAARVHKSVQRLKRAQGTGPSVTPAPGAVADAYVRERILCPLNRDSQCAVYDFRPIACRLHDLPEGAATIDRRMIQAALNRLSSNVFFAFSGFFMQDRSLTFSMAETVSGKYVQEYFYYLAALAAEEENTAAAEDP